MVRPATKRSPKRTKSRPKRTRETRERLLEVAGQVFAEKGYERTTAKEIAKRAGINAAAVNYYFGGVDELYLAVIEEARSRSVTYEKLAAAINGKTEPVDKLQAMLEFLVRLLTGPFASSWMARIFARELVSPSPVLKRLDWRDTEKRLALLRELVGAYAGLHPDDPEVAYACWSLAAPFTLLLTADRRRFAHMFPEMDLSEKGAVALTRHLERFALGGLQTIARRADDRL
jgi:AcrR family transcriptional regulator